LRDELIFLIYAEEMGSQTKGDGGDQALIIGKIKKRGESTNTLGSRCPSALDLCLGFQGK
jgi:hypothetical protein